MPLRPPNEMIIRCDNCSVSLQLDESKVPNGNFTVRCPRCQNMLSANRDVNGNISSSVQHLEENQPAPAAAGASEFAAKESDFEINNAMRSLLTALAAGGNKLDVSDDANEKPRRILLCLGE